MSVFLDTRGNVSLGIGICARCGIKMPVGELVSDPNSPGLKVCRDDLDQLDPYRLPARQTESITMEWTRPDLALSPGPMDVPVDPLQAVLTTNGMEISTGGGGVLAIAPPVTPINPSVPWTANTYFGVGAQVTPGNPVGFAADGTIIPIFLCIIPGLSGHVEPTWPNEIAVEVIDYQIMWLNQGIYLP